MAYHVGICKVEYHHVVLAAVYALHGLFRDLIRAHFGFKVICGHLGGGDKRPVLAGIWGLHAAVEEERNVRVLLRFSYPQLRKPMRGHVFAKRIRKRFRLECNRKLILKRFIVLRHGNIGEREAAVPPFKAGEIIEKVCAGYLARPVRTEVEEYNAVIRFNLGYRRAVFGYDHRHDEFIRNARVIGSLHGLHGVCRVYAFAVCHCGIGLFNALEAVVPVHCIVAAHYGCNLAAAKLAQLGLKLLNVSLTAFGRNVAPVHKAMHIHLFKPLLLCKLYKGIKMVQVAVHAAIGTKAEKVQLCAALLAAVHGRIERGIFKKVAVLY